MDPKAGSSTGHQNILISAMHQSIPEVLQQQQNFQNNTLNITYTAPRKRRPSKLFSVEQVQKLSEEFDQNQYPSRDDYQKLAKNLGADESKIRSWFANNRQKRKKTLNTLFNFTSLDKVQPSPEPLQEQQPPQNLNPDGLSDDLAQKSRQELQNLIGLKKLNKLHEELTCMGQYLKEEKIKLAKKFGVDIYLVEAWFEKRQKYDDSLQNDSSVNENENATDQSEIPLTKDQVDSLQREYAKRKFKNYTEEEYKNLSKNLGIHIKQIKQWFQKRQTEENHALSLSSLLCQDPYFSQEQVTILNEMYVQSKDQKDKYVQSLMGDETFKSWFYNYCQKKHAATESVPRDQPHEPTPSPNPPAAPSQQDTGLIWLSDSEDDFDSRFMTEESETEPKNQEPQPALHQQQRPIFLLHYKLEDLSKVWSLQQSHCCNSECAKKNQLVPVNYDWCKI